MQTSQSVSLEPVPLWEMGKAPIFQEDKLGTAREEKENYPICVEGPIYKNYLSEGKPLPLSAIYLMWDTKMHTLSCREKSGQPCWTVQIEGIFAIRLH